MANSIDKKIEEIIKWNVERLGIEYPIIEWCSADKFRTLTTRIACSDDGKSIRLNERYKSVWNSNEYDLWLDFSHEIRHCWQMQAGDENFRHKLNLYKSSDELEIEDYNGQEMEIDAWAWAVFVMEKKLKVRPLLEELFGVWIALDIDKRKKEIEKKMSVK